MDRVISSVVRSLDFLTFLMDLLVDSVPLNSFMHVEPKYYKVVHILGLPFEVYIFLNLDSGLFYYIVLTFAEYFTTPVIRRIG